MLTLLVAFGVGIALATSANAFDNPVMDFGSGYAMEGTRAAGDNTSTASDNLVIVGHVAQFKAPFNSLDANDPSVEYTYVYDNLVSVGTQVIGGSIFDTDYTGGRLRVFCDPSQDSDFSNLASFANGTLILEASLSGFRTHTDIFSCAGDQNADITAYTGGSLVDLMDGCTGAITGLFSTCASVVPDTQEGQGYFALSDTKLDSACPTPVEESTWGKIKKMYQD
jgi:hypothetical protein